MSVEKQVDIWRQGLADNGLKASRFEVIDSEWHLRKEEILAILPVFVAHYNTITESGHKFDVQSITDAVFDAYVNPKSDVRKPNALNELKANPSADKVVVHMKIMSLIATK
ncbi:unnamed protein product [Medioppia subpectinata]|uniref:Uncharacterized protein n=1 Tax=Medioppia subpectinata TaxID=1979941 RepID=A0A7R9Q727_9ACAR|nr:unnamed protein product [Medioppia subpectinata]CAG2113884.1 unnamed protein product [Medioppia subpectinata]